MWSWNGKPYGRPAVAFAGGLFVTMALGGLVVGHTYQASTSLVVTDRQIRDEWDLLKDETRGVDFEEQIKSRKVLESALRKLLLTPPPAKAFIWFKPLPLTQDQGALLLAQAVEGFRKRVTVRRLHQSGILEAQVTGRDPIQAAREANAVVESFIEYRRQQAMARAESTLAAIQEELNEVGAQMAHYASIQEEAKQLAAVNAQLSQAMSRYKEASPLIVHLQRQQETLSGILFNKLKERQVSFQELLHREQAHPEEAVAGTTQVEILQTSIAQANERYRQLLDQQAKVRLSLALLRQPGTPVDGFAVLDEALPVRPVSSIKRLAAHLGISAMVSLLSLFLVPLVMAYSRSIRQDAAPRISPFSQEDPMVALRRPTLAGAAVEARSSADQRAMTEDIEKELSATSS